MVELYFKIKAIETMIAYGVLGFIILGFIIYLIYVWWCNRK